MRNLILTVLLSASFPILLNAQSILYKPLQIVTDTIRYTFTYDASGNELMKLQEKWLNGDWINFTRTSSVYSDNKEISEIAEQWVNGKWQNYWRYTYNFDNSGRRSRWLTEIWTGDKWENGDQYFYNYDYFGNISSLLYQVWSGNWTNTWIINYSHDISGRELSYIEEHWSGYEWVNFLRITHTYNEMGKIVVSLQENWANNSWINYWKDSYSYDNSGNLLNCLGQYWFDDDWENSLRDNYIYNNSGQLVTLIYEYWLDGTLFNGNKFDFNYDAFGNALHGDCYIWNGNSWMQYYGTFRIYYNNNHNSTFVYGSYFDAQYTMPVSAKEENVELNSFALEQNYPNPFNPSTTIKYSIAKEGQIKLAVYDALGTEVAIIIDEYKPAGNYSIKFNGDNLASGIYIYRLQSGSNSISKKFVLVK